MDQQDRVATFVDEHDWETALAYRVLDLQSEVGEIANEVTTSTGYGSTPETAEIAADEIGDTLFALLAVAESVDVDAGAALETAISKYERRIEETGSAASGR